MYINTGYGTNFPNSGTYLVVIIGMRIPYFILNLKQNLNPFFQAIAKNIL